MSAENAFPRPSNLDMQSCTDIKSILQVLNPTFYILSIQFVKPGSLQLSSATHTRSQLQIVILCQNYITMSEAINLLHLAVLFLCFAFLFASVVLSCLTKENLSESLCNVNQHIDLH